MKIETMRGLTVGFLLALCSTASLAASGGEGVVLSLNEGPNLLDQCRETPDATAFWLPDSAQISELDNGFDAAAAAALAKRGERPSERGYNRQYIGVVAGGKKRIYVNAFFRDFDLADATSPLKDYWRTHAIQICDGGSYYFGAVYDPATKTFSDFAFNGGG